jgi:hypothetical protein
MSDGLEDAYIHNTIEAAQELINTYGTTTFFEALDVDTYKEIKDFVFSIENVCTRPTTSCCGDD